MDDSLEEKPNPETQKQQQEDNDGSFLRRRATRKSAFKIGRKFIGTKANARIDEATIIRNKIRNAVIKQTTQAALRIIPFFLGTLGITILLMIILALAIIILGGFPPFEVKVPPELADRPATPGTPGAPDFPPIQGFDLSLTGPNESENCITPTSTNCYLEYNISYTYDSSSATVPLESITIFITPPAGTRFLDSNGSPDQSSDRVNWSLEKPDNQTTINFTLVPSNDIDYRFKAYATSTASPGGGNFSSNSCTQQFEGSGYCSVQSLLAYFNGDESKATIASMICQRESTSNPFALNTNCSSNDYSVGLFQINLVANCPGAYNNLNCNQLASATARDVCEQNMLNPVSNIQKMVSLSSGGTSWSPWSVWPKVQNDLSSCNI